MIRIIQYKDKEAQSMILDFYAKLLWLLPEFIAIYGSRFTTYVAIAYQSLESNTTLNKSISDGQ